MAKKTEQEQILDGLTGREEITNEERIQSDSQKKYIKMGTHGANALMTSPSQQQTEKMLSRVPACQGVNSIKEQTKTLAKMVALTCNERRVEEYPDKIGFNISNKLYLDLIFSVLNYMTETKYKGDKKISSSESSDSIETEGFNLRGLHIGGQVANFELTPIIRVKVEELVSMAGLDPKFRRNVERVESAMEDLSRQVYFLAYNRPKRDRKTGKILYDKKTGRAEFEFVSYFSPILKVKTIRKDIRGKITDYEIGLSDIFLDELSSEYGGGKNGHFILIPEDANAQIEETYHSLFGRQSNRPTHSQRMSPVVQAFHFWLRLKVQEKKSRNLNKWVKSKETERIIIKYQDLCQQLNISEASIISQKTRTRGILEKALIVAKELGYITRGEYLEKTDEYLIDLNFEYYPQSTEKIEEPEEK